jgi:hypothetical protein
VSGLSERARGIASIVLATVAAILVVVGIVAFYARTEIIDQEAFGDRAVAALDDDEVRHLVGREIVTGLIDRGSTDLVAARPLVESIVDAALQTEPFRRLIRSAAVEANRTLFVRDHRSVALDLSDAAKLVRFAARSVSPKLAREIPDDLEPDLLKLQKREFATQTLRAADHVRTLGIVLPLLALLVLIASIAIAPDRRIGVLRAGIAVGASGLVLAVVLLILRARLLAGVVGADEVTDQEVRDAVAGILDAFVGGLVEWSLALAFGGVVIAAAAAALDPADVEVPAARLRRMLLARPQRTWLRAARGVVLLLAGIAIALEPTLALQLAAILVGAYFVFAGTSELLLLLQRRGVAPARALRLRKRALAAAMGAAALAVAIAAVAVLALTDEDEPAKPTAALPPGGLMRCNGSVALCDLRLNEAVFAGTHNSFSAADSPNWFITNQRRTIKRQLQDGIRLFLIDPHWGVADGDRVRTDFHAEGRDRNRVAKSLPPPVLAAAQRLAGRVGLGDAGGKREVWLCHTVCELGATRMSAALGDVRNYLRIHRGEIVILFVEPYVPPAQIEREFEDAGLTRYVATLDRSSPLPTLGRLVRTNRRLIVLTEKDADGTVPWYLDGFSFVQDTPLGAKKVSQLRCKRERGTADSPLLMLNHWADLFPPQLTANRPFQTRRFLLERAHKCARARGMPVNLIAVDFYDQGALVPTVEELNGEQIRAVRRERALAVEGASG